MTPSSKVRTAHSASPVKRPLVVAIGGSAGGLEALVDLVKQLKPGIDAIVLVALHRPVDKPSHLKAILSHASQLPVRIAANHEILKPGTIYISDTVGHLTFHSGRRAQVVPDSIHRGRNINLLFESVATEARDHGVGIVLSGMLHDGSEGLRAIKAAGGRTLVQSPEEAEWPSMPQSAIHFDGPIDLVAPVASLAEKVNELAR
jgi:two-component system chemotaxis response regulator CheB